MHLLFARKSSPLAILRRNTLQLFPNLSMSTLSFNPQSLPLPYGVVAAAAHLSKSQQLIALNASQDAPVGMSLALPSSNKTLTGQSSILRYLARASTPALKSSPLSASEAYPESLNAATAADVDQWLSHLQTAHNRRLTPKDILGLVHAVNDAVVNNPYLVNSDPTLADFALWGTFVGLDRLRTRSLEFEKFTGFNKWMAAVSSLPSCQSAIQMVNQVLDKNTPAAVSTKPSGPSVKFAVADDSMNPLDIFRQIIAEGVAKASGISAATILPTVETRLSAPMGQFCIPVPRLQLKGNPAQIGKDIATKFPLDDYKDVLENVTTEGIFLNFVIKPQRVLDAVIPMVYRLGVDYGTNNSGAGKNIVIEFSSPNIAKPFHAGHLRSTIIGNFIRNVCRANGMNTTAINYLGDWGKQYGLLAVGYRMFGNEAALQSNPIGHLFDVYVKINAEIEKQPSLNDEARAYFKRMEDGDTEALALWKRFRDLSIDKYRQIYSRLNVEFDIYSGESQYGEGMRRALEHLKGKNLLSESNGAQIIDLEKYKMTPAIVQKADGATLYITRDIAAAWERQEQFNFDQMYYVVAAQQDLHFQQLFKILDLAGFEWSKQCTHINFGMVKGMSTRKGTVVFLEDILEESKSVMHDVMQKNPEKYAKIENPEEVSDIIGLSAVIIQDMSAKRIKDYEFKWERMTSFEGDTGPYLQYSHARMCSIERKLLESLGYPQDSFEKAPFPFRPELLTRLDHPKIFKMLLTASSFPDLVSQLPKRGFEACNVVTFLMTLCHEVSSCLDEVYVMGQEKEVAEARFWAYWCARMTLSNGMRLLGLKPLERM